jgi:CASC3/Barentsz eIF4AIII binding
MPTQRRANLLRSRRRTGDDGEDVNEAIDDSQSDASAASDADVDDDGDFSDLTEPEPNSTSKKRLAKHKMPPKHSISAGNSPTASFDAKLEPGSRSFHAISDTEAMMNGLKISDDDSPPPAVDFDDAENEASQSAPESSKPANLVAPVEKKRMGHDEYKKKLETDPMFIPTRGNFFMHDERTAGQQNGLKPYGRGRGRGRVPPSGPFPQATYV